MGLAIGSSGGDTPLWKAVFKINTDDGGIISTFWLANVNKATARLRAAGIGTRMLGLLPVDAEIFNATVHPDDLVRNGFLLPTCIGAGTYGTLLTVPAASKINIFRDSVLIRRETADGLVASVTFGPMPDPIIEAGAVTDPVTAVIAGVPADPGDPVATDDWKTRFNNFLKYLQWATNYVQVGHVKGGAYKYDTWESLYVERTSTKKGGRVFTK